MYKFYIFWGSVILSPDKFINPKASELFIQHDCEEYISYYRTYPSVLNMREKNVFASSQKDKISSL